MAALGGMFWSASEANAQETITGVVVEETPVLVQDVECKDIYTPGSWKDNWFIQLGAGIRSPFVENVRSDGKSDDRHITAIYNLGVGRWISPYLGFRFSAYYGSMHWNEGVTASARVANLNVDFMWDMFNSIGGYRPKRVFSIVPYIGLGGSYVYHFHPVTGNIQDRKGDGIKSNQWLLPVSAGLQLRFRLSEYVDFFAEGRAMFYGDNFNDEAYGRPIDIDLSAVGGFTFHLTGSKFKRYNPCDYVDYINNANAQINDLRGALATTSAALAAAQAQLPCPDVTVVEPAPAVTLLPTVRFKINSAYVSSEEMVNVYNVAEYLKANPNTSIVVRGYADEDTGTSEYNMKLSERRAQAVADILVGDYGIDSSRLVLEAAGSNTQVYDTNDWNRIVIFAVPE
ncbi:OmpA family protein [Duncaniella sp.]|uniref:OmpA family protein n=1 Tax=Duncaniella sp. TaxID=2518496 RepID=UPI0023BDC583|nr:OmpA family protein [Duncaniella sp.]MDE5904208.1 OmpA family protein [Duncaniella sp.]